MYQSNQRVEYYQILFYSQDTIHFQPLKERYFYDKDVQGIRRKAFVTDQQIPSQNQLFIDNYFQLLKNDDYSIARLYDFYEEEVDLFPKNDKKSSLIDYQQSYNSFLAQSGLLHVDYLRTLFITQTVNKIGYYRYFVKRDGQYFINCVDDTIPVDKKTKDPLWGLSLKYPWQLILLKVWLKEKKTWQRFKQAEPFQLLDCFGLPGYRSVNFRKEIRFMKEEDSSEKEQNIKKSTLNSRNVFICAKTVNSQKLQKIGLPPNLAAFKIMLASSEEGEYIYRVESSIPVGCKTKSSILQKLRKNINRLNLSIGKVFLMSEKEILKYFNKFYLAPDVSINMKKTKLQDNIPVNTGREENWLSFSCLEDGLCSLAVELPRKSYDYDGKYSQIKLFLSRKTSNSQLQKKYVTQEFRTSKRDVNQILQTNCDKWENYLIEYQQGYHYNLVLFNKLNAGQYIAYIKVEPAIEYNVRFLSQANFLQPKIVTLSPEYIKQVFDSTFYQISQDLGIQTTISTKSYSESISLANTFDQIGFGIICIKTLVNSQHKIAMRIKQKNLKKEGMDLCHFYYQVYPNSSQTNIVLVSEKGMPQTIVLEKLNKDDKNSLNKKFPPPECVQFFKLTPDGQRANSRSLSKKSRKKSPSPLNSPRH